jgi:hypothetical protein
VIAALGGSTAVGGEMSSRVRLRVGVLVAVLAVTGLLGVPATAASADSRPGPHRPGAADTSTSGPTASMTASVSDPPVAAAPDASIVQAAQQGVANAAAQGIQQSVSVIDRSTGELVADVGGEQVHNTESLTKLFTAAYYLEQAQGSPGANLAGELGTMIEKSDDDIQSSLWRSDIVPTVAQRYGLTHTTEPTDADPGDWGSDRTTADDMVTYLLRASQDPWVGASVLSWMGSAQQSGDDGFDQSFGLFTLSGDRGVKQGWSDPDWEPRNLHSVGWTDKYFIAILQTSASAGFDTMRATSTDTAQLLAGPSGPATSTPATSAPAPTPTTSAAPPASTTAAPPASTGPASTTGLTAMSALVARVGNSVWQVLQSLIAGLRKA